MTKATLRRALGTAGLALGGLTAGLVLAELVARLTWHAPVWSRPGPGTPGLPVLGTAAELARPNVLGVYNGALFRTNGAGFRGREYAVPKPPGVFRIAIAGDSFTMGSGVREEEAYPFLVERGLNARGGDRRYEVLNLGLIGLNLRGVLDRLEALGLRMQPDLIVYGCTLNDIKGRGYRESWDLHARPRHRRFNDSPSYLLRVLWPRWVSLAELVRPQPGSGLYEQLDNYFHNPPVWAAFVAGLDRLARIAERERVPAVVFVHTNLEYLNVFHPEQRIYRLIASAAEARGLRTIQSFPHFRGYDAESLWLGIMDGHPNRRGHELLARALLDGLAELPPEYWQPRR